MLCVEGEGVGGAQSGRRGDRKRPTHFTGRRNRQTAVQTRTPFLLSRWQSGESFPYGVLWFRLCTIHLVYYEVGLGCFLVVGSFAACLLV